MCGLDNMDTSKYALIILNTFVRKTPAVGVYEKEFYECPDFFDPDDEGNSWEAVYRLMRCPKPKTKVVGC